MIQMSGTMMDTLLSTGPAGELNVWCYSFLSTGERWSHNAEGILISFNVMYKQGLIPAVP